MCSKTFRESSITLACFLDSDDSSTSVLPLALFLDSDDDCTPVLPLATFLDFENSLDRIMASTSCEPTPSTSREGAQDEPIATREGADADEVSGPYVKRHLYSSEVIGKWNLAKIIQDLGTREQCVAFAEEQGLIEREKKCYVHKLPMRIDFSANKNVGAFVCNKGNCRTRPRIYRSVGTWFENIKVEMPHVFYLMYSFAHHWAYDKIIWKDFLKEKRGTCLSSVTISDWYSYCRETIVIYQLDKQECVGQIGGPGKIVQIDESKFGKRKYNKGMCKIKRPIIYGL